MLMEIPKGSPSCFILLLEESESLEYTLHTLFGRGRGGGRGMEYRKGHTLTMPLVSRNIPLTQVRFSFSLPQAPNFKAPSTGFLILS
jgi:hypothetical protein